MEESTVYDKQRKSSAKQPGALQLRGADAPGASSELRGMSYSEGQAHLAPAVQLSATAKSEGGDKEKLLGLVSAYAGETFGGDMQRAFDHYAKGGVVDQDGVTKMLVDSGVKKAFGFVRYIRPQRMWRYRHCRHSHI